MADETSPSWPQTTDGRTDWETVFEDPKTGLIALITGARSAATLRKSTVFVIETIYAQGGAPPEINDFSSELELMLPDNLPDDALPNVADAVCKVLREIKDERIRQENDASAFDDMDDDFGDLDDLDDLDDEDGDAPKKKKWWQRKKKPKKPKKAKKKKKPGKKSKGKARKGKGGKSIFSTIAVVLAILIVLSGVGGGVYFYFFVDHQTPLQKQTQALIDQMIMAAEGNGPDQHAFGASLTVEERAGLTGVTAMDIPAEVCTSVAWYFANRGNVLINDSMPTKIAPSILKRFCEKNGQAAKVLWLSKAKTN